MMIIIPGFHRASQSYLAARVQCSPDIGIADTDRVLQRLIQQQTTTTTKMSTMVMVMMEHHGRWWRNDRSRSRLWSQIWIVIRNVKTRTMLILTITTTNNNNSIRNINDNNEEDNGKRMKKPEQASMSGLEWRRRLFCLAGRLHTNNRFFGHLWIPLKCDHFDDQGISVKINSKYHFFDHQCWTRNCLIWKWININKSLSQPWTFIVQPNGHHWIGRESVVWKLNLLREKNEKQGGGCH